MYIVLQVYIFCHGTICGRKKGEFRCPKIVKLICRPWEPKLNANEKMKM